MTSFRLKSRQTRVSALVIVAVVMVAASLGAQAVFGDEWSVFLVSALVVVAVALLLRAEQQFRRAERRDRELVAAHRDLREDLTAFRRTQGAADQELRDGLRRAIDMSMASHERLADLLTAAETLQSSAGLNVRTAADLRLEIKRFERALDQRTAATSAALDRVESQLGGVIAQVEHLDTAGTATAHLGEQTASDVRLALERFERLEGDLDQRTAATSAALDRVESQLGGVIAQVEHLDAAGSATSRLGELTAVDIRHTLARIENDLESRTAATATALERVAAQVNDLASTGLARLVTVDKLEADLKSVRAAIASSAGASKVQLRQLFEQIQSTISLFKILDFTAFTPPMRGWAASPDALAVLLREFRATSPRIAVECGSGMSTLVLALAAKQFSPDSRVVALEHEESFARQTEALLREHGVSEFAQVRVAPLRPVDDLEGSPPWYDRDALEGLDGIDLLFVDGPPASTGPLARHPALPVLWSRLGPEAVILMDDLIRQDEQDVRDAWVQDHPELEVENIAVEKGIAILRRPAGMQTRTRTP